MTTINRHSSAQSAAQSTAQSTAQLNRRRVLLALGGLLASTQSLSALAMDNKLLATVDEDLLQSMSDRAAALNQLHALIVVHRGSVVFDHAFRGADTTQPVNVKSVSKTLIATLTGMAITRGYIKSIDQTLGDAAPELIPANADPKVARITVSNLLSMQAGLQRTSGRGYGAWVSSPDWIEYVLTRPFVAEPGKRMLYSTGSYHVLGAVLTQVTGQSLLSLSRQWLGEALDIEFPAWTKDPQGFYMGGNEMALSPLALARFGELFRQGGVVDGRRILSGDWIETAWTPLTRSPYSGHAYGLGWFLALIDDHRVAYARGYGGQLLYVLPSLELTVVITSDIHRPARSGGYIDQLNALLSEAIIPALA